MGECSFDELKPVLAMVSLQCIYAVNALLAKAVFTKGMNPMVFTVYRQAIAFLALAPTSIFATRRNTDHEALGAKGFSLVFLASLLGGTLNQVFYYHGLELATSSMATAVTNLIPAITFVMAASMGMEKVKMRCIRSMAKVFGTMICVGGAIVMALLKGPKLLNFEFISNPWSLLHFKWDGLMIGCFFLMGGSCCWSLWLIVQVPICKSYLDPLSLSTWMCFLSTIQSAIFTFFLEPDLSVWKIHSGFELLCCLYSGLLVSAFGVYIQAWCVSKRGPLFAAMFNPLCTVTAIILAYIFLHEELYVGSLGGIAAVIAGLYAVLWGKAKDYDAKGEQDLKEGCERISIKIDEHCGEFENNMNEPLLPGESKP